MIKGVIIDFDQTMIDSRCVEYLRKLKKWDEIKSKYSSISLINGVDIFFNYVHHKELLTTILSNAPRKKYMKGLIEYFNIKVDHIIGYEDTVLHKPNIEPMKLALKKMSLKPEEVIAIGDDIRDCIAAKNTGVLSVYINDNLENVDFNYIDFATNDYNKIIDYINNKNRRLLNDI